MTRLFFNQQNIKLLLDIVHIQKKNMNEMDYYYYYYYFFNHYLLFEKKKEYSIQDTQIKLGDLLNLNILLSRGKESNDDSFSNGE